MKQWLVELAQRVYEPAGSDHRLHDGPELAWVESAAA